MPKSMACGMSIKSSEHHSPNTARWSACRPWAWGDSMLDSDTAQRLRGDRGATESIHRHVMYRHFRGPTWYELIRSKKLFKNGWDMLGPESSGDLSKLGNFERNFGHLINQKISKIAHATPVNQSSYCDVISKVSMSSWSASISVNNQRDPSWRFECSTQSNDISIYFLYARWSKNQITLPSQNWLL